MKFGLSEEQRMLIDSINGSLKDAVDIDRLRAASTDSTDTGADVRSTLAQLGVFGLLVPEEHGGVGLGSLDAALVAEQLGAVCAPAPFIGTAVATRVLTESNASVASEVLPTIADGSRTVGLALDSYLGGRRDAGITAERNVLNGKSLFVLDFDADSYLVATADGSSFLLAATADGVIRESLSTIDGTRRFGELRLENAQATLITTDQAALDSGIRLGRVLVAADALGAAQHMLNEAIAYAKERKQFNRVIGSFQAVKHMCAEMAAELEPCRSMLWYAGHALDARSTEAPVLACQSKSHITEVAGFVAKTATEVHGGMGFTDLLGLHYWFKRIGSARQMLGSPEQLRDEAARVQGFV